jgi:hypothetical protein
MNQRPYQHVVTFLSVEDVVGLKAKAPMTRDKLIGAGSDAGEFSQETERALKA